MTPSKTKTTFNIQNIEVNPYYVVFERNSKKILKQYKQKKKKERKEQNIKE